MIIGSMTGRELFEIFKKDKSMLEKFAIEKAKKLIRELRKGMGQCTTQCYDFKTKDATEYKVCVYVNRGNIRQFYFDMFIYCKETNDYVCATSLLDEENSAEQFSYTPHFLRRYAERALGIENMPINRVLAHIEREVAYTVLIYKNDTSKVVATSMGLYLQKIDYKRGINICKTFVSVDMFKSSQIKAYMVVADLIKEYSERYTKVQRNDNVQVDFANDCLSRGITEKDLVNAYGESEDLLDKEQKELLASERKVNAKIQMLMHDALNVSSFSYDKIGGSLCTLLELTSQGGMREKKIMQAFFNGERICNIAEEFELSRERVRQIVIKAIRKFNYAIEELADLKQENNSLKEEIKNVKMQLIMQEGEKEEEHSEDVPPSVFSIRLVNCNLPVRVLNVTKAADIDTIGDLVQYSKFEMVKFRNFGKKSLMQLDEFIHEMGLEWGMDKAKIYARGIQRMKDDTYIEELFGIHLADITSDIEKKYNLSPAEAMKRAYSEMKRYVGFKEKSNE